MPFRVSGKNISIGTALRGRVNQRIALATAKYFDGGYSGHMTIGKDGSGFRSECVVHLDSGVDLEVEATALDAYSSVDQAAERIEKRLRRYKRRLKGRQSARANGNEIGQADAGFVDAPAIAATGEVFAEHEGEDETTADHPVIIAESAATLKRMSVSDAAMQLDRTGAPVLAFRHAGHGRANLVYRRADGHIGWIDHPSGEPKDNH
jgi:ribosomal subunit interface protein